MDHAQSGAGETPSQIRLRTGLHAAGIVLLMDAAKRLAGHFIAVALGEAEETAAEYCRWCLRDALCGEPIAHAESCPVGEVLRVDALLERQVPIEKECSGQCESVLGHLRCSLMAGHDLPHSSPWTWGAAHSWTGEEARAPRLDAFGNPSRERHGDAKPFSTAETEQFWNGGHDARRPLATGHDEREIVLDPVEHATATDLA